MKTGILVAGDLIGAAPTCVMLPLNPLVTIAGIAVGGIPETSEHSEGHTNPVLCADGELMNPVGNVTIAGQAVFSVGSQCGCENLTHTYERNPFTDPATALLLDQVTVPGV